MDFNLLYRKNDDMEDEEIVAIHKHFPQASHLITTESVRNTLVVGRYCVLPFYKEVEDSLAEVGSRLINSYHEHRFVADIKSWYPYFEDITPKTYFDLFYVPKDEDREWVLKGETNSRKWKWNTHMYAKGWLAASQVLSRLLDDSLIGQQDIYVREFVPLVTFEKGINGLPITKEFRVFIGYGEILSVGYYWSNAWEDLEEKPSTEDIPKDFLADICNRVKPHVNFVVVDVAQKTDGSWIVVELNDGQMSGLSMNDPDILYGNLRRVLENQKGK